MKRLHNFKCCWLSLLLITGGVQAQEDSSKPRMSVIVHHFTVDNSIQYLLVETKMKVNNKWQRMKGQMLQLYLDTASSENLIARAATDSSGQMKAIVPANLQTVWATSNTHKFIAVTNDGTEGDIEISKAKILMDTSIVDSARMVNVQVLKWKESKWEPVKGVDLKIGVKRLGGYLKIGDEETYSTDSLGAVAAQFKIDSLPGDPKGNVTLVARVEDDEQFGSLSVEKVVPWGKYFHPQNNFGERALWASRGRAPVWLVLMAYSIIIAVWGVIFYLVFGIVRISRLGKM